MRSNRRIDNRGMTLVELLIAVTILAVIVVPLLHAFVSSARINRKAKESQRLTTLGQDIMEGLKAYSVKELAYEFDYPAGCSEHGKFQLIKPSMIGDETAVASNVKELKLKSGTTDKFEKCTEDDQSINKTTFSYDNIQKTRYFAITNVSSETLSGNSYRADVFITIDPKKYTSSGVSEDKVQHNDKELAHLSSMDTTKDAFYVEPGTQIKSAFEELKTAGANITSAAQMTREISIIVDIDPANSLYKQVTYKFKYSAYKTPSEKLTVEYPKSTLNIAKYETLENVYLFYVPSYDERASLPSGTPYDGDNIIFSNSTDLNLTFNLIKRQVSNDDQLDYKYNDPTSLGTRESTYKCRVDVNDILGVGGTTGSTELRTNADTDLSVFMLKVTDPSTYASKKDDMLGHYNDNVKFYFNGIEKPDKRNSAVAEDPEDRIFDVTIDIYEAGTINDAIKSGGTGEFPVEKHLVTVKGNMN